MLGDLGAGERGADPLLLVAKRTGQGVAGSGIVDPVNGDDAQHDLRIPLEDLVGDKEVGHPREFTAWRW